VTRIRELGTELALTSNWSVLRRVHHIPQDGILYRNRMTETDFGVSSLRAHR
jgi:hypothetical protein